jgi:peptidyl-prolyl cis-trans isomerase SurA
MAGRALCRAWLLLLLAAPAGGQDLADHVVAVVDKDPIFASDVERAVAEEVYVRQIRGEPLPADSAELEALKAQFVESLIDRRIVIAKARKEEIEVTATEVEDGLDQWLNDLRKSVGSDAAFLAELGKQGMTLADLKARYRREIEEQLYVSKFMRKQFGAVDVTEDETSRFFLDKYDSIPDIPEVVDISHLVVSLRFAADARDSADARRFAESIRARLVAGESFDSLAKSYSDDATTRDLGGRVGEIELPSLSPAYQQALVGLSPGDVSQVVLSPAGCIVLKLWSRMPASKPGYEEARAWIRNVIEARKRQASLEEWLAAARQEIYVKRLE